MMNNRSQGPYTNYGKGQGEGGFPQMSIHVCVGEGSHPLVYTFQNRFTQNFEKIAPLFISISWGSIYKFLCETILASMFF